MRDGGGLLLQSISQGPSRVFVLAKGAVPPEDEQDGQRQGEEEGQPDDAHRRLTLDSPCSRGAGVKGEVGAVWGTGHQGLLPSRHAAFLPAFSRYHRHRSAE